MSYGWHEFILDRSRWWSWNNPTNETTICAVLGQKITLMSYDDVMAYLTEFPHQNRLIPTSPLFLISGTKRPGWDLEFAIRIIRSNHRPNTIGDDYKELPKFTKLFDAASLVLAAIHNSSKSLNEILTIIHQQPGLAFLSPEKSQRIIASLTQDAATLSPCQVGEDYYEIDGDSYADSHHTYGVPEDFEATLSFLAALDPALFADPAPAPAAPPAPKTLKTPPPPKTPPSFSSLLDDPRFSEVGELIRQLLPMLALPLPRGQSQEMPVGGVSGIDNRGQPHQLLLSELANDDLLLCARMVHGEAFYQQRERPPSLPPQNRVLLLDSGLRFLGMPRLICAACALAFRLAPAPPPLRIQQNGRFVERPLSSLDEAHEVLQNLDPALSCAAALKDFLDSASPDTEPILISHHRFFSDAAALDLLRASPCRRHFLILFDPEGACDIHLWTRLGAKRIGGGKLDLDKVVEARKVKEKPTPKPAPQVELGPLNSLRDPQKLPLFYRQQHGAPLWIPLAKCSQPIEIYDCLYTVSHQIIFRLHSNTSLGRLIHFVNYQVSGETDRLILKAARQQILEQKLKVNKAPTILRNFQQIAFDPRTFMLLNGDIAQVLANDFRWWGKPFHEITEKAEFLWAPTIRFEAGHQTVPFSPREKLWEGTIPLSFAKFNNYTIGHDRRFGLLHFLPSDETQPEITLTLSAATRNALWFSTGEACGNPDFIIPGNRIISDEEGYQRLIRLLEEK